jgi:hypothetical protein
MDAKLQMSRSRKSLAAVVSVFLAFGTACTNDLGRSRGSRDAQTTSTGTNGGTSQGGTTTGGASGNGGVVEQNAPASYTVANSSRSIVSAAKTLAQRIPNFDTELSIAAQGEEGYRAALVAIMSDGAAFREAMVNEHRAYLGVGGSKPGTDIDFDEPARLGGYLVANNIDYRELLTAKYCVDRNFQKVPCSTFKDQPSAVNDHGAGVLSTRGFIAHHKPHAPFNFRFVMEAFEKFACSVYPDVTDPAGTPAEVVSSSFAPWGLRNGRPSECYTCHKAMNPKAYAFYNFNAMGFFTQNMDSSTRRSSNEPSPVSDVIVPGGDPIVKGKSVKTMALLGQSYAADPRFAGCMVKRYVNFMLGRPYDREIPKGLEGLVKQFEDSGYNVRELLMAIANTGIFVNRANGGSSQ